MCGSCVAVSLRVPMGRASSGKIEVQSFLKKLSSNFFETGSDHQQNSWR